MACCGSKVIEYARGWNSYQEKRSMGTRAQLEQKHWNPGSANLTIFWEWFKDWGYTKWYYQGSAWCACFVSCCFVQCFGLEKAKELLGGDLYINCQDFVDRRYGKKQLSYTPTVGAVVCFYNGKKWSHTGIVTGVYKTYITSIEGNTSGDYDKVIPDGGAVCEKKHFFSTTKMIYWAPAYDTETSDRINVSDAVTIGTGKEGVTISADLNYRESPYNGKILGTFKKGEHAYPSKKCFVSTASGTTPWFYDKNKGWFSANYISSGWIYEECGRWWYISGTGYKYDVNKRVKIGNHYCYFDNTGYCVQSQWVETKAGEFRYYDRDGYEVSDCYVKSKSSDMYYWIDSDGVWLTDLDTPNPDLISYRAVV